MKPSELLSQAGAWTQHNNAVDGRGIPVVSNDIRACAWCLLGAIARCASQAGEMTAWIERVGGCIDAGYGNDRMARLHRWNDRPERTVDEVISLLKECGL